MLLLIGRASRFVRELTVDDHEDPENANVYTELCYLSFKPQEVFTKKILGMNGPLFVLFFLLESFLLLPLFRLFYLYFPCMLPSLLFCFVEKTGFPSIAIHLRMKTYTRICVQPVEILPCRFA